MAELKRCKLNKVDCFAYCDGRCKALTDTNWHGKPCSFYKPVQRVLVEDPKFFERRLAE